MSSNKGLTQIGILLEDYNRKNDQDKFISKEFQKYGYELAEELGDLKNKSLYIKLAKITPRVLLEQARSFVSDAQNVKSKGKLFMWKLSKLKTEKAGSQVEIAKQEALMGKPDRKVIK